MFLISILFVFEQIRAANSEGQGDLSEYEDVTLIAGCKLDRGHYSAIHF